LGDGSLVDALVYVFHDVQWADDVQFLREFSRASGGDRPGVGAAIGVLSRVDEFADGPWGDEDPIATAAVYARRVAEERSEELAGVLPVAALLAQAASAGAVTESRARELARWADASDADVQLATLMEDDAALEELRDVIGDYGVVHGRAAARDGAGALRDWLERTSGVDAVRARLSERYLGKFPQAKATHALDALARAVRSTPRAAALARVIDDATNSSDLHALREFAAWQRLGATSPDHPLVRELDLVLGAADDYEALVVPRTLADDAVRSRAVMLSAAARREAALSGESAVVDAARVLSRSYALIAERFSSGR
jgi:hypothetical protein